MSAQALAFDHLADALARHRAGVAHVHATVRLGSAAEAVALDRAGESAALHGAGDVHEIARLEGVDLDGFAHGDGGRRGQAFFAQEALRSRVHLAEGAELRLARALVGDVLEAELNGVVAVLLLRSDLRHYARTGLDNGHSGDRAVLSEQLCHSTLASQDQRHDALNSSVFVGSTRGRSTRPERTMSSNNLTPGHAARRRLRSSLARLAATARWFPSVSAPCAIGARRQRALRERGHPDGKRYCGRWWRLRRRSLPLRIRRSARTSPALRSRSVLRP